eukprot:GHVU01187934.1.p3 GENE.GHVU01187934.1~~GHVU01187934.1.p3  ORF type:complete len:175 (-),score=19.18 GHVU01187934.1:965-1489(-)
METMRRRTEIADCLGSLAQTHTPRGWTPQVRTRFASTVAFGRFIALAAVKGMSAIFESGGFRVRVGPRHSNGGGGAISLQERFGALRGTCSDAATDHHSGRGRGRGARVVPEMGSSSDNGSFPAHVPITWVDGSVGGATEPGKGAMATCGNTAAATAAVVGGGGRGSGAEGADG